MNILSQVVSDPEEKKLISISISKSKFHFVRSEAFYSRLLREGYISDVNGLLFEFPDPVRWSSWERFLNFYHVYNS